MQQLIRITLFLTVFTLQFCGSKPDYRYLDIFEPRPAHASESKEIYNLTKDIILFPDNKYPDTTRKKLHLLLKKNNFTVIEDSIDHAIIGKRRANLLCALALLEKNKHTSLGLLAKAEKEIHTQFDTQAFTDSEMIYKIKLIHYTRNIVQKR